MKKNRSNRIKSRGDRIER